MGTSDCSGSLGIERYASPYQSEINQLRAGFRTRTRAD